MNQTQLFAVTESSETGEARREVARLAGALGFGETDAGRAALVVTEAAGNLVKHARGGQLLVRALQRQGAPGIELLALDSGPGMRNPAECLRDGFSTAGSPGTGLGAIARAADLFEIHSLPEVGTAVLAQVRARTSTSQPRPTPGDAIRWGCVSVARSGEPVCGDGWAVRPTGAGACFMVADGLGHGVGAADASREAERLFGDFADAQPAPLIERLHRGLRGTRGVAAAVALVDLHQQTLRYAAIGNISGTLVGGAEASSLITHNGIVGHEMRRVQEFTYPLASPALLVLHSDGLHSRWDLARYPGLRGRHPSLIAGVLYRDYVRGRDDVTVLVVALP
jgi:anti-sigma regulatory factor (Ser/Thr protein kinase)